MDGLKYVIFFSVLLIGVPIGVTLALSQRIYERLLIIFMMVMSVAIDLGTINFFTEEEYRGTSRGFEVSVVDIASLILFIVLLLRLKRNFCFFPPGVWFYLLYFFCAVISMVNAANLMYSGWELWKMLMMWMLFLVFYNYFLSTRDLDTCFYAFGILTGMSFLVSLDEYFHLRQYQPSGLFIHQNTMVMYMALIGPIFLARLLEGKRDAFWQSCFWGGAFGAAAISVVLSVSRGGLFFFPLGCGITMVVSLLHGVSSRKWSIVGVLGLIGIVGMLAMLPRVITRFETAPETSKLTRIALANAAVAMANDCYLGVGINNWGVKINPPYPYDVRRYDGTMPDEEFKNGLVETIYLMVAAECGWGGLVVLLLWFGYYYWLNLRNLWSYRRTTAAFATMGILGGLTAIYGQSVLEWVLKQSTNFYQLMIIFSLVAAMTTWRRQMSKRRT